MGKRPQRQQLKTEGIEGTSFAKPRRDRNWDKEHNDQVASYRIPVGLKQTIKDIAEQLNVSPADVARALLENGLDAYERGNLQLAPQPKQQGQTLYPKS